ncbi:hypothetical protein C0989_008300 [Termitomyces sp. Mn162]|nr:hypothetical protein C0989_008300 [Termitomyces sp. Mn162]
MSTSRPKRRRRKPLSTVAIITMIFQTPKKLIAVAKAFSPAWITNLSPARLFTTNPTPDESMILDPPTWPENVARNEFWENGAHISPQRRLRRCYGPNGSFHRSIHLKQLEANRAWNVYQKKRSRYEAQQARQKHLEELNKPVPLDELHIQAVQKLSGSDDPEDRIFLRELGRLRHQTDNLEKFAPIAEMLESLEEYREEHRARVEYAELSARKPRVVPSFSTFQRERRNKAVLQAATRKRQQAQRAKPTAEEEKREKERKEAERKRKEYEEERARERESARVYVEKVKEQGYREQIRIALEQGRPPPDHLQHRQDLIQEIAQVVTDAALRRQQDAALRARIEREQRFARQQEEEARCRVQELEAKRRMEEEARRFAEERARVNAELFARRQAKLAEEQAAREAEQRRREQEEAQRQHAEALAREEEARQAQEERRAQEEARRAAEEEARRRQQEQEQARRAAQAPSSAQIFKSYDDKWEALRGAEAYSDITFVQFPWPVLYQIFDVGGITLDSVRAFFLHRGTRGKAMKAEILKWHPDKLNNQLHQVHPEHREQVREAGELVAKFLNNIMEN